MNRRHAVRPTAVTRTTETARPGKNRPAGLSPVLLHQVLMTAPAQAGAGQMVQLQRYAGNQAVAGVLQRNSTQDSTAQQQTQSQQQQQQQPDLKEWLDPKKFKKAAHGPLLESDRDVDAIDLWLKTYQKERDAQKQKEILQTLWEACNYWLQKHPDPKKSRSVKIRRPIIEKVKQAAEQEHGNLDSSRLSQQAVPQEDEKGVMEWIVDRIDDATGIVSAIKKKDIAKGIEAGGMIAKGGFSAGGQITTLVGEKTTGETVKGIGQAVGDAAQTVVKAISMVNSSRALYKEIKARGAKHVFTEGDKPLEVVSNVVSTGKSGVDTAKDIASLAMGSEATAVKTLGQASGVLDIVHGTIDIVRGGLGLFRAHKQGQDIKTLQANVETVYQEIKQKVETLHHEIQQEKNLLLQTRLQDQKQVDEVWEKLKEQVKQLRKLHSFLQQFEEQRQAVNLTAANLEKIRGRRMEEDVFKVVKGGVGIAGGIAATTGAGAVVTISMTAVGAILSAGKSGVQSRRNAAVSRLMDIASRLTDEGKPKGRPDAVNDYRQMEQRIYKCYYNHLPQVIKKQVPPGLKKDEFTDIKQFAWTDKRQRIGSGIVDKKQPEKNKKIQVPESEIDSIPANYSEEVRKNNWFEVHGNGKVQKEKPKGLAKIDWKVSTTAHKSDLAIQTAQNEVVNALYAVGTASWDAQTKKFGNNPIKVVGSADPETEAMVQQTGQLVGEQLMAAARITPADWEYWLKQAQQEATKESPQQEAQQQEAKQEIIEQKMKEYIRNKIKVI
ncbi:MAG: hypothetical protein D6784_00710 [Chloroflexi bacterium]|nr:MAG: hypothetical protein D6784_00710 [Chloroflexota bacterium]